MAKTTVTKALNGYFNSGDGKVPAKDWLGEMKKMTALEKIKLAREVVAVTGDELVLNEAEQKAVAEANA
jgi:hypothetical protein